MQIAKLVVAIMLAGMSSGQSSRTTGLVPRTYFVPGVPYTKQMPNFCGPASLSSLLAYWNVKVEQQDIGCGVYDTDAKGTNAGDLLMYCREMGLSAYSLNSSLPDLKRYIYGGYPVLVLQDISDTDSTGHYRVAVGYDDRREIITLRDSIEPELIKLPYKEFTTLWAKRGYWAMLVMPQQRDVFEKTLGEGNAVVHLDLAKAYLHKGDYDGAEKESLRALSIEPTNRYAKEFLSLAQRQRPQK